MEKYEVKFFRKDEKRMTVISGQGDSFDKVGDLSFCVNEWLFETASPEVFTTNELEQIVAKMRELNNNEEPTED